MSKVLAVGDIHTKRHIIYQVAKIMDNYDKVVFVGDYADDWSTGAQESIATWREMKQLQEANPEKVIVLAGNHDYVYTQEKLFMRQSGYNVQTRMELLKPENKDLFKWVSGLPLTFRLETVLYSHAGVENSWSGQATPEKLWQSNSPLWSRPMFGYIGPNRDYTAKYKKNRILKAQVFGHTPQQTVNEIIDEGSGLWCIDTFSTNEDGTPVGDGTVLVIDNGKVFTKHTLDDLALQQ